LKISFVGSSIQLGTSSLGCYLVICYDLAWLAEHIVDGWRMSLRPDNIFLYYFSFTHSAPLWCFVGS
jgi:hypothetical protein